MPAKKKPVAAKQAPETLELGIVRKLAEILNETGLTEIELDHKGARVRVSKASSTSTGMTHYVSGAAPQMQHHAPAPAAATPAAAAPAPAEAAGTPLKSPMVGTAYLSPSPGQPPFAALGSQVKEGQTLLIIEAMKTMNQIAAPKSGKLVAVNIENSQPVEFGEVLMVIE